VELNESATTDLKLPFLVALKNHERLCTHPDIIHGVKSKVIWKLLTLVNVIGVELIGLIDFNKVVAECSVKRLVGVAKAFLFF
jgi:hypothetical protein